MGRDIGKMLDNYVTLISIHAPRVGRDDGVLICTNCEVSISIHAPRVGRDQKAAWALCWCS